MPLCRMQSGNGRCSHRISRTKNTSRLGTERVPVVDGGCWKVPERTRGEPEEGAGGEQGAKGKKKGSIRGGVLPYVGEGR